MMVFSLIAALAGADPDVITTARPDETSLAAAMAATPDPTTPSPTAQDATPHGLTTEQQIGRWLEPARRADLDADPFAGVVGPVDDRQMHGMVEAGIGTGGYRSYGAAVSLPIGENARLDLTYREAENDYGYGYGYPGYGYDGYGYGVRGRRGLDSSSRSMSLGFSWEKDSDSRERRRSVIPDAAE